MREPTIVMVLINLFVFHGYQVLSDEKRGLVGASYLLIVISEPIKSPIATSRIKH